MWLCRSTMVDFFVGFHRDNLDSITVLIRQISHIKSLFVSMLQHNWNLRYSRYFRITNYVGLELFLFIINLDVVSSSNVFSTLVFMFRCNIFLF